MPFDALRWRETQLERLGPLVGGSQLITMLGYRTPDAFEKARTKNLVGVRVFRLENRRGWYALTTEVCEWLLRARASAPPLPLVDADE